jgi:amino acid adenylation domain-containing protein
MGMFVNTLPLVTTLDHHEKIADFLRRVSQSFSDTIEHENYPFARIASRYDFHPQISYAYQIGVLNDYRTKYGAVEMEGLALDMAKVPVAVYIVGTEDEARIKVDYDTALFSEEMMLGLAKSIENAVRTLMESDNLSQVSLTGKEEWKVLDSFNAAWDLEFDKADTVVTVFRRNAKTQPDKVAAVFKDKAYTYRELDELTDRLAAKLYAHASQATGKSVLAEEVVSILLNRNENVFILPLAAVKAGLAYEPLDPSYPKERLNFMVKDAGACLLVAEESLLGLVDEYEGPTVTVEELYASHDLTSHLSSLPSHPSPSDLLIMLYTSGSTGLPKGCQIEHRNMVAYAHGVRNDFYRRDDRIAAYASFGFDVNMSDIFCTLLNGGTVYLIPEEIRMNLDALARYFDEAGITALLLTTQVGVQFLQNYPQLKTLRMLVMGGEKLPAVDPSRLSYTIVNGYGPTENCCGVSLFPIRAWEPNIPIGKPMATIHGYVLDKTGHRLPAGAAGEYCLSGPQVSRGYLNRPDKTAEAYEPSPFNEFRMYHTGDIVRYRQNGDVEFVGRKDGQVKIRGFRIETKEVEAVIRGFSGIRDVTVQAYDYEGGGKYLAAFVVSENTIDMDALREYIKGQKPAYMVPAAIVQIEKIPLTVNQKVDKKALPEPRLQKAAYVAPEGKAEEDFCAIFEEVLGVERVSAEDDFFEVGGNSILAMKVVVAAGKAGYSIVYNDVFQNTTPRALAAFTAGDGKKEERAADQPKAIASSSEVPEIGRDGYDYGDIHALLARNTLEAFRSGRQTPLTDVLLFGGTGYLGSHVLRELMACHDVHIWCFVRPGKDKTGEQRLKDRLSYYFGDAIKFLITSKVTVVEGDATDSDALLSFRAPAEGMTVINCAASVKHFAKGNEIERTNVGSVKNITVWCEKNEARLVHISTGSVTGSRENNVPPVGYRFDEHRLFAGQELESNQYIHSKFMAERHIYEEVLKHGLKAKVMRVGNLAPRAQDGEFQVNYTANSYMNSLQAYQALGFIPYDALVKQTEFSPIDALAKAILALATTPEDCVCFMPMNTHRPLMGDIIRELSAIGNPIQGVENEMFAQALSEALSSEAKSQSVSTLIAYKNNDNLQTIGLDGCNSDYTNRVLERLGFSWPETGSAYIRQFIERLAGKGFFKC